MKLVIKTDNFAKVVPSITFSVFRDEIYPQVAHSNGTTFNEVHCAEIIMRYNFVLRNFAMIKNRYNISGHSFTKLFLDGMRLTHDYKIADEKDLMWFTMKYEHSNVHSVIDVPDVQLESYQ